MLWVFIEILYKLVYISYCWLLYLKILLVSVLFIIYVSKKYYLINDIYINEWKMGSFKIFNGNYSAIMINQF